MADDSIVVHSIEIVETPPEASARKPHTLYIPEHEGKQERDRYLGAFMDRWSEMERQLLLLIQSLLKIPYATAEVIFHSSLSIKTPLDMIRGLITLSYPPLMDEWKIIEGKCFKLSTNRNHLVHGYWTRHIFINGDDNNQPIVDHVDWVRVYMTGDPDLNARAVHKMGEAKTGQHRYDLGRIKRKMIQVVQQHNDLVKLREKIGAALPGESPPPTPAQESG